MTDCADCREFDECDEARFGWDGYHVEDAVNFARHFRSERDEARAEIERLQAIVERLPKTADGVPVYPGMQVWYHSECLPGSVTGPWVVVHFNDAISVALRQSPGVMTSRLLRRSFSTREAAEAAGGE